MDDFWDAFVFRVWSGMGEHHPRGFPTAAKVLEQAHRLHLLPVVDLNDLSLLLILLTCPVGRPLHEDAARVYLARNLSREEEAAVLREALPPHLTELHLLGFFGQPRQSILVRRLLYTLHFPALSRFMARMALTSYTLAEDFASPFLDEAHRTLQYTDILDDLFLSNLYTQVMQSDWPRASGWPKPRPPWEETLTEGERSFLNGCLLLSPGSRWVLYLSFFARLNPVQIAQVFHNDLPGLRPPDVVAWLSDVWGEVLGGWAWVPSMQLPCLM
jgi:hypothetical protein